MQFTQREAALIRTTLTDTQWSIIAPHCLGRECEASCGAQGMRRVLAALGHEGRLMPPGYVRPNVKAQKNDDRDAEAIAEAATSPGSSRYAPADRTIRWIVRRRGTRFVEPKSEEQLDIRTLHRVCERLVGERSSLPDRFENPQT